MTRINTPYDNNEFSRNDWDNRKETEILSVLINGEFKTVVFVKMAGRCFIVIGDTDAYTAAMYWNSYSVNGLTLIRSNEEWYETTKEEGNAIYAKIMATQKTSKNGRPYYRYTM